MGGSWGSGPPELQAEPGVQAEAAAGGGAAPREGWRPGGWAAGEEGGQGGGWRAPRTPPMCTPHTPCTPLHPLPPLSISPVPTGSPCTPHVPPAPHPGSHQPLWGCQDLPPPPPDLLPLTWLSATAGLILLLGPVAAWRLVADPGGHRGHQEPCGDTHTWWGGPSVRGACVRGPQPASAVGHSPAALSLLASSEMPALMPGMSGMGRRGPAGARRRLVGGTAPPGPASGSRPAVRSMAMSSSSSLSLSPAGDAGGAMPAWPAGPPQPPASSGGVPEPGSSPASGQPEPDGGGRVGGTGVPGGSG